MVSLIHGYRLTSASPQHANHPHEFLRQLIIPTHSRRSYYNLETPFPQEIYRCPELTPATPCDQKLYKAGLLPGFVGGPWRKNLCGIDEPGGEGGFDPFMELILIDELCRCASGGVVWAVCGGISIGLPPILHFGSEELKKKVAKPVFRAEKFICLCITEPWAGSDVANIRTTAKREGCVEASPRVAQ
eukprot:971647-Amorphochlora_amoeboformis.AAC.1